MHNQCCNRRNVSCQHSCECRNVERVVCRRIREKECRPITRRTEVTKGNWQNCGPVGGGNCRGSEFEGAGDWAESGADECSGGGQERCCSRG